LVFDSQDDIRGQKTKGIYTFSQTPLVFDSQDDISGGRGGGGEKKKKKKKRDGNSR